MSEIQKKLTALMTDFDDICCQNDITYALYGKTAAQAYKGKLRYNQCTKVMMSCDNLLKFVETTKGMHLENRTINGMFNDKDYAGLTVRFSDTTTSSVFIYSRKKRKFEHGIYVEIIPVRNTDSYNMSSKDRFIEQGYEYSNCPIHLVNGIFSKFAALSFKLLKFFKLTDSPEKYFYKTMQRYSGKDKPYYFTRDTFKKPVFFSIDPLNELIEVNLIGHEKTYFIPENSVEYFRAVIGNKWSIKANKTDDKGLMRFTHMSVKQLKDVMSEKDLSVKAYKRQKYIITDYISKKLDKRKSLAWQKAQIIGTRIELTSYYEDKMDRIHNLIECNDLPNLYKIMDKNRSAVREYLKLGLGFAVNRELFNIQNQIFLIEGKYSLVERLNKITPDCFLN